MTWAKVIRRAHALLSKRCSLLRRIAYEQRCRERTDRWIDQLAKTQGEHD